MHTSSPPAVIPYWRPGCGYCASLRRRLRRAELAIEEVNIWHDRAGAAFVRSVARGCETVPTVVVGSSALINPTAGAVLDLVRQEAPHLLPERPPTPPNWYHRLRQRVGL
jgi:glutaredoxin